MTAVVTQSRTTAIPAACVQDSVLPEHLATEEALLVNLSAQERESLVQLLKRLAPMSQ